MLLKGRTSKKEVARKILARKKNTSLHRRSLAERILFFCHEDLRSLFEFVR